MTDKFDNNIKRVKYTEPARRVDKNKKLIKLKLLISGSSGDALIYLLTMVQMRWAMFFYILLFTLIKALITR